MTVSDLTIDPSDEPADQLPAILPPPRPGTLTPLPAPQLIPALIAAAGELALRRLLHRQHVNQHPIGTPPRSAFNMLISLN